MQVLAKKCEEIANYGNENYKKSQEALLYFLAFGLGF